MKKSEILKKLFDIEATLDYIRMDVRSIKNAVDEENSSRIKNSTYALELSLTHHLNEITDLIEELTGDKVIYD